MSFSWMTTRRWMIAVAVISALLGTKAGIERREHRLREHYYRIADDFSLWLREYRDFGGTVDEVLDAAPDRQLPPLTDAEEREVRKRLDHFMFLRSKYEYALRHPWLPVLPDPPWPE